MLRFCQEHGIPYDVCGKVIVATAPAELSLLENLHQRGVANGLKVQRLSAAQVAEIEPHVRCLAGIQVPSTGIVAPGSSAAKHSSAPGWGGRMIAARSTGSSASSSTSRSIPTCST